MDVFLETLIGFFIGAIIVERLTAIVGDRFIKLDKVILSMVIGVVISFYGRFNILALSGLTYGWNGNPTMEYVGLAIGIIFSGLILSTGSNGVHDFISKLQSAKELTQAKTEIAKVEATLISLPTDEDVLSLK